MKTTLYYFTGTGNSLWGARELARHIPDAELVPMARLIQEGGDNYRTGRENWIYISGLYRGTATDGIRFC